MNWIPSDDPFDEHASHFPLCVFVRYVQGSEYVKACNTKRQNSHQAENGTVN
jgi:hypothetical protein